MLVLKMAVNTCHPQASMPDLLLNKCGHTACLHMTYPTVSEAVHPAANDADSSAGSTTEVGNIEAVQTFETSSGTLTRFLIGLTIVLAILTVAIVYYSYLLVHEGDREKASSLAKVTKSPGTASEIFDLRSKCASLGKKS